MESFGDQASSEFLTLCCSSDDNLLQKQGDQKAIATLFSASQKLSVMVSANRSPGRQVRGHACGEHLSALSEVGQLTHGG